MPLVSLGTCRMTENTLTFKILQEMFEEWGQKIVALILAIMHACMNRLCPKDIKAEISDMKENIMKIYKVKR